MGVSETEPTLRLGYREASLSIRGISVFLALAVVAIITSNFYSGYRIEQAIVGLRMESMREHMMLRTGQDRTSCILTMSQEDRGQFRLRYQQGAFKQMCPWMEE
jgi:hypothetical protein